MGAWVMTKKNVVMLMMLVLFCCFTFTVSAGGVKLPDAGSPSFEHRTIATVPLHIFSYYDSKFLSYTYTTSETERQAYLNAGYRYEGIVAYLSSQPLPGTYGLYKMRLGHDRYLALGEASRDACIAKYGYQNEGLIGYVYPRDALAEGDTNVNSWYKPNPEDTGSSLFGGQKFSTGSHAYHYYLGAAANLTDRKYEGVAFRAWSKARTLQQIKVLAPNAGGTFEVGNQITIQWQSAPNQGTVDLRYAVKNANGWSTWVQIADQLSPSGSYTWTIPSQATGEITILARWGSQSLEGKDGWAYDKLDKNLMIKNTIKSFKVPILKKNK
jgi:hypothetical protein